MQSFVSFFLLLLQRPYLTSFRCFVINLVLYCTFSISYSLHANPKKCRVWGSSLRPEKARRITQLQSLVRVEFTLVVEYKCSCNYYTQNLPCSWHLNRQPKGKSPETHSKCSRYVFHSILSSQNNIIICLKTPSIQWKTRYQLECGVEEVHNCNYIMLSLRSDLNNQYMFYKFLVYRVFSLLSQICV